MIHPSRTLLAGLLFISCTWQVYAQEADCDPDQSLSHAESEFHAGHFYSIPGALQPCFSQNGFSNEQKVRAYQLLCQVYLIIDDPIAAEDSYLKLLEADPEFVPNEKDDPIDIVYLSKKFTATPIFTPHFRVGINGSFMRTIHTVSSEPYSVSSSSALQIGFQAGAGIDWNIDDNLSLCIEADFSTRGFSKVRKGVTFNDEASVVASQNWLDVPLYFKYSASTGKIRPFGYAGYALNLLFSAKNEFRFTDTKPDNTQLIASGPNEQVTYQRNMMNRSWLVGGGVKYKMGKDFVYVDLRYMGGTTNITNENKIYYMDPSQVEANQIGNPDYYLSANITKYHYLSDLYRLDNISLSFGFIHPIYDPRKMKKAKTKGVLRKIRREEGGEKK